ncbi:restriction modification system DNA specificity domain-containing protein [Vibrio ichthyoenteri ATCC 700023]|uniref:Restriction modification system DNA specificity domain-containing protein n=1 Tax=Vibrio ichthyoenteri ATCC 700023 TaxID=870968 RepID=F9S2Y6_9VIBR|nr:restriction endonuclease subunit S [Vibrio ichthyoenteri]EGU38809.1 restriction modification system DNA specificity domain-containing protein [Vibrio ichthyoenteri ATCC 700023]
MNNWSETTLGKVAEVFTGYPFKSEFYSEGLEDIKLLRGDNIAQGTMDWGDAKKWPFEQLKDFEEYQLKEGDVVLAMDRPWIGAGLKYSQILKSDLPALLVQRTARLRGSDVLDTGYLKYIIGSPWFTSYIKRITTGSVVPHISLKQIREFPVKLPSLEEQRSAVAILQAIDKKIELNNRINSELEAMAKTLYEYWFVQFDFPDVNGKPYKACGGKMVYNSVLKREIPQGWSVNSVSDWIRSDKTGDWGKESKQGNYTLQVDCIRGADINGINGQGNVDTPNRFILKKNDHKLLAPFDFVIEISGGSPTQSTGRMAFITEHVLDRFNHPLICSNFCKAIDLIDKSYFYNFAYQWKSLYENGVLFGWEGKTSGIKNLLFDSFVSNYKVVMPPTDLAEKFFQFVSPLQEQKQKRLKENAELESLRDWLLPMLMNGQVMVNPSAELKSA